MMRIKVKLMMILIVLLGVLMLVQVITGNRDFSKGIYVNKSGWRIRGCSDFAQASWTNTG